MNFWSNAVARWPLLRLQTPHLAIIIVLCINALLYLAARPDPDYYWHLRTGQYILETRTLPDRDPFSYTAGDRPWVLHEWLAQVVMATVEGSFGYAGLVLLHGFLASLAFLLEYLLLRRLAVHYLLSAVLTLVSVIILLPFISVRPLVYTWVFLTAHLLVLVPYHRGVDGGRTGRLWWPPLLMILWANLHGGFFIGIVLTATLLAVRAVERLIWGRPNALVPLGATLLATVLATLLNPAGLQGALYPLTYLGGDNASREFITEWQSPNFHMIVWTVLLVGPILGGTALGLARANLGLWPWAVFALTATMALQSVRFIPIFGLMAIPAIAEAMRDRFAWAGAGTPRAESERGYLFNWTVVLVLGALAMIVLVRLPLSSLNSDPLSGKSTYPERGAGVISACYPGARMYNFYGWGGYLIWRLYPEQRVFIDGRADLHGAQMLTDYVTVARLRPGWDAVLEGRGVDLVIFEKDAPLSVALRFHPEWQEAFEGPVEAVFVRRSSVSPAARESEACRSALGQQP